MRTQAGTGPDERKGKLIMMAAVFIGIKEVMVIVLVTAVIVSIVVLRRRR
ncbi:MAG: hypothetical protein KAY65_14500 [Planctomycetes bacterium]|nr:hypothetical protein [Planctomycetota bacterium]